jgi:ribosomal protein L18E
MKRHKKKIGKLRGKRTHGGGFSKRRRGKGSRMTHHRTWTTNIAHVRKYEPWRFTQKGFVPLEKKLTGINIGDVEKLSKENEIDVTKFGYGKVLGGGKISKPLKIKALKFSEKALKKLKEIGGEAVVFHEA